MRVLFVCQSFAPLFEGGTERVAHAHAAALLAAGAEVAIVAGAPAGSGVEAANPHDVDGLAVYFVEERPPGPDLLQERLLFERPAVRAEVLRVVRALAPDVVHVQHSLSLGLVPALAALGLPVFVSLHDLFATCPRYFRDPLPGLVCPDDASTSAPDFAICAACIAPEAEGFGAAELAEGLRERARRFATELAAATLLLAPSASHARRLERLLRLAPGAVRELPNGLVTPLIRPATSLAIPGDGQPLELLSFGHRVRAKGVVELVRAASLAAGEAGRPLHLTLAGAPLEPGLDAELARLAPPARLTLLGPFLHTDLERLASRAHVAVFPSKALESYGLVVDEALALGLPVLAANAGALGERVGAAGRVLPRPVDEPAVAAWATALLELVRDPSCLLAWRAAIPDRMPGPEAAASQLLELYRSPHP